MESAAQRLGINISEDQLALMEHLLRQLQTYNEHTNLVSKADPQTVVREHVIDAMTLVPLIMQRKKEPARLIDIGSGAGFPGLILAILVPNLQTHLVDSVGKKTRFLSEAQDALCLQDRVVVHTGRAEELAHQADLRHSFDFATARAVGTLDLVAELCLPFLKKGGWLLAQKSRRQAQEEMGGAEGTMRILGGKPPALESADTQATGRDLVIVAVEKSQPTPPRYPRHGSQLKRPLK